jgi:branched-chain amino acid transport system permease protein
VATALSARPGVRSIGRTWPLLVGALLVAWLIGPATDYEAFLFNTFLAYVVASVGTVFLVGWSGQVSFAQACFFGIGAYTTAHLARGIDPPLPVTVLLAAGCAAAFALPMAIPAVRLRGVFLALTTLAYQAAIERFLFRQIWFTLGGEAIPVDTPHLIGGVTLDDQRALALVILPMAVAIYGAVHAMRRSKVGRALVGMHRREGAMAACGIAIPRYRLLAFVAAAFTAGAGGSLLTYALTSAPGSNEYTIVKSVVLLAIPVIGGITRLEGAVVGSPTKTALPELIRRQDIRNFNISAVMGFGLFLVAVAVRGGILGFLERARQRERERFAWLGRRPPAGGAAGVAVQLGAPVRVTLAGGRRLRISPNGRTAGAAAGEGVGSAVGG